MKPGSGVGELVEDAARLAEVERVEVVAVDEAGGRAAASVEPSLHRMVGAVVPHATW